MEHLDSFSMKTMMVISLNQLISLLDAAQVEYPEDITYKKSIKIENGVP